MQATTHREAGSAQASVVRHLLMDRLLHWCMAVAVVVLLVTAFLPIMGIKFAWVTLHWATGLLLLIALCWHVIRSMVAKPSGLMLLGRKDLRDAMADFAWFMRWRDQTPGKPGKYSAAQKLMHHSVSLFVITTVVTGLLMMVKIDTPLWKRDPYWLSDTLWGFIYILHDLAALSLITIIMIHIYFALRPEKRCYTRSMIRGWLTRTEYLRHHDPEKWRE